VEGVLSPSYQAQRKGTCQKQQSKFPPPVTHHNPPVTMAAAPILPPAARAANGRIQTSAFCSTPHFPPQRQRAFIMSPIR
jgi:hypothetical protein